MNPLPALVAALMLTAAFEAGAQSIPRGFKEVRPAAREAAPQKSGPPPLAVARGSFFNFALPPGWRVGEDGQFALTLVAPDQRALTVMVGNAGVPPGYPPAQYAYEKLMAIRPEGLQLGQPRSTRPVAGFAQAVEYPVRYTINGVPCQGVAKVHIAPGYDSAVMAMTAALSEARQWPDYARWLPLVADQISANSGAAFGARGIMAQNLQNSSAYAEAARQYRDWSQKNWQAVTDARADAQERNQRQFREALGNVQTYANPYDARAPVELPNTHQHYWINARGTIIGTDNPNVDPNAGSDGDWRPMQRRAR